MANHIVAMFICLRRIFSANQKQKAVIPTLLFWQESEVVLYIQGDGETRIWNGQESPTSTIDGINHGK